ncbi:hypothetical protein [Nocardioides sp. CFH 31398]|uniref:hypothetical protein n=1 Tax=Nocardioides sp. CFH 31398 TaxID=2919579 RepID=UPI001F06B6BC|nr:hypothetical protein [Nocardioides sp. CFH 31398]MCH1865956.1 hypothetical protein [Nocardioides sp. CFH 31398]
MSSFDTAVDGDPVSLRDCARWLRGTLRTDLGDAAARQAEARRDAAAGWEGVSCEAYRDVGAVALAATDAHAARVGRAADDVDAVADRMDDLRDTMRGIRAEARGAGLLVTDRRVTLPVDVGPDGVRGVLPDPSGDPSPTVRRATYERLERRADAARNRSEDWITSHLARAGERAAEGDVEVLRRRLGGPAPGRAVPEPGGVEVPVLGDVDSPGGGAGAGAGAGAGGGTLAGPGGGAGGSGGVGAGGGHGPGGPARWGEGEPRWVPGPGAPPTPHPPRGRPRWVEEPGRPRWEDPLLREPGEVPVAEPGRRLPWAEPGERPAGGPGERPVAEPGRRPD